MKKLLSLILALCIVFSFCAFSASADGVGGTAYPNPLQDVRVRQALWYAIDMDAIVDALWNNTVVAAKKSLVPEGFWQADGLTEYNYNPDLARQLLAEAGWDGSYTLKAVYYTGNLLDTITAIQAYWADVGVNMEFQLLTDNLTVLLWSPSPDGVHSAVDWDLCFAGTNALTLGEFYNRHHSTAAGNSTVLPDPELDALIDAAKFAVALEDQKAAFDALGDRRGAVVVMEASTGKIIAEVSKPDFDPNTIGDDYEGYVNDAGSSVLLNRALNGLYPPGSVFKIVTALSYMRENPSDYKSYSYDCTGSLPKGDGSVMHCYGNEVHGALNLKSSFARSCNTSFANMGLNLNIGEYRKNASGLLFNKHIKSEFDISKSSFVLNKNSSKAEIAETAIGQGQTLVTPIHMCLIAAAVKNKGVLMTPYIVDHIESADGSTVRSYEPSRYRRLMSKEEAKALRELMNETVQTGTGRKLSGAGDSAGGKTGSAEYSTNGASHGWFAGYASKKGYEDIAIAVIVEDGNTGSASAVPVAGAVFDAYFDE